MLGGQGKGYNLGLYTMKKYYVIAAEFLGPIVAGPFDTYQERDDGEEDV